MASEQREDFERRLLAKVRASSDYLEETYQEYEMEHFVLTFRYYIQADADCRFPVDEDEAAADEDASRRSSERRCCRGEYEVMVKV